MKKFLIIFFILILIFSGVIIYLNKVILPKKVESLIITALKSQTGKDVSLKSVRFNLFKGLVIRELIITDNQNVILSARQVSCGILVWPILKKQIIIPSITLKNPYVFLERRQDNTFNLQSLLVVPKQESKKSDFSIAVLRVNVVGGNLVFQDDTLEPRFKKEFKNIQINLYLSLPSSVKFNFKGEMTGVSPVLASASGQYKLTTQEFSSDFNVKNLPPEEFKAYYRNYLDLGLSGLIDFDGEVNLKGQVLNLAVNAQSDGLILTKENLKAKLVPAFKVNIDYNLNEKKLDFKGTCIIAQADISGVPTLGQINNLKGRFSFDRNSLVSESLKAQLLGKQLEINLGVKDFKTPVLMLNTELDLSYLPQILKEKFNLSLINLAKGQAQLEIKAHPQEEAWDIEGSMDIRDAELNLEKQAVPIENIFAKINFNRQGLSWDQAKFKYQDADYNTSGSLDNFNSPAIQFILDSSALSLDSQIKLIGKKINIDRFKGRYYNSQFSASGNIDNGISGAAKVDLSGSASLNIEDISKALEQKYAAIKEMKLSGKIDTDFNFSGNPADFKNCYLKAKINGQKISLYGLNTQNLSAELFQDQKIAKIASLNIGFYDGTIEGTGWLNLDSPELAYQLELKAQGIKLEKLKNDTASRNKNIAGNFNAELKLSGASNDPEKVSGQGNFSVKEGKLWELSFLEGIGKLLFAREMGSISITECRADFQIKDKFITTDSLKLQSNMANLSGPIRIGFDNSLEGNLQVEILSDMVPVSGTLKDLTTAFAGQAGSFGSVKLSGTLKDPKYSFKPQVGNLIRGITDVIFGKQKQQ